MSVANHPDIQCVELSMPNGDIIRFLNVYNDPDQFKALEYLEQRFDTMPDIHVMTGDFNLHHPIWDAKIDFARHQKHREKAEELIAIAYGGLHLDLTTDPQGKDTWLSHRRDLRDSIIDLVFIGDGYTLIGEPEPTKDSRMNSDHSPVFFKLNIETYIPRKPRLKRGTKEAVDFVEHVRKAIDTAMPKNMAGYPTRQSVEDMGNIIESIFLTSWNKFASVPDVSNHSKSWWNAECSKCIKHVRFMTNRFHANKLQLQRNRERCRHHHANSVTSYDDLLAEQLGLEKTITHLQTEVKVATNKLRGAVRRAKRLFFDGIIAKTHSSRIWDQVEWTRPRRLATDKGLTD